MVLRMDNSWCAQAYGFTYGSISRKTGLSKSDNLLIVVFRLPAYVHSLSPPLSLSLTHTHTHTHTHAQTHTHILQTTTPALAFENILKNSHKVGPLFILPFREYILRISTFENNYKFSKSQPAIYFTFLKIYFENIYKFSKSQPAIHPTKNPKTNTHTHTHTHTNTTYNAVKTGFAIFLLKSEPTTQLHTNNDSRADFWEYLQVLRKSGMGWLRLVGSLKL